ncbi:hypothetical protein K466DRAFT_161564 [Polyporus arcularius HHB13444]|uniref:Uncharacterized protein n=1 Tax=Polyporus arcularius HHB13444 TaxID=1314778 RepID=A0A5C3PUJ2_9APHY|nr:hypothetical protein K466DRAFT_161564 [Polyporus arcularius HHB13444]
MCQGKSPTIFARRRHLHSSKQNAIDTRPPRDALPYGSRCHGTPCDAVHSARGAGHMSPSGGLLRVRSSQVEAAVWTLGPEPFSESVTSKAMWSPPSSLLWWQPPPRHRVHDNRLVLVNPLPQSQCNLPTLQRSPERLESGLACAFARPPTLHMHLISAWVLAALN